jgi:hypothetical protein
MMFWGVKGKASFGEQKEAIDFTPLDHAGFRAAGP